MFRATTLGLLFGTILIFGIQATSADACTRVLHVSQDGKQVVTGRNMDWYEDLQSNLWLFPRSMEKSGAAGENSAKWVSKYGSVIMAGFDAGTLDGLNEKGLMVNLLYLAETDFGKRDLSRPGVSWSAFTQYLLDNFATVSEAVDAMKSEPIQVVPSPVPGSVAKPPTLHFSLSDAAGDSAIFEYLKGKLVIHHSKAYAVMTNSPTFDKQLVLDEYWETIGGKIMLPGTTRAADRFVRASYYQKNLPDPKNSREAIAGVMSVMANVSSPYGVGDPEKPNISQTIWRTAADNLHKLYYFESTLSPYIIWVDLKKLDFSKGASVRVLKTAGNYDLAGDVTDQFEKAKPFVFIGPDTPIK